MVIRHRGKIGGGVAEGVSGGGVAEVDIDDEGEIHLGVEKPEKFALDGFAFGDGDIAPEHGFLDGAQTDILEGVEEFGAAFVAFDVVADHDFAVQVANVVTI